MKFLWLFPVVVLSGVATAETIIGEFSGNVTTSHVSDFHLEYFEEAGVADGDLIVGSFAYQSDAAEIPIEEITFGANIAGASFYKVDYLRVQFGNVLLERSDVNAVTATAASGSGFLEQFLILPDAPIRSREERGVELAIFPGENGESPIFSNDLPLSTEDFNPATPIDIILPSGLGVRLFDQIFTVGPACNPLTHGDSDGDGLVAFSDFLILSSNFGNDVMSHKFGDIDCDGSVQFADFLVLFDNFGGDVRGMSAVPEPDFARVGFVFLLTLHGLTNRRK